MAWWVYVVIVLGLYVLAAGIPWLGQWIVERLLQRDGPFPHAEADRRWRLQDALQSERQKWPSIPRLGRFREPDQKALDHLSDLGVVVGDIEQLWPTLTGYTPADLSLPEIALLKSWPAFITNLSTRKAQKQAQTLLQSGEAHVEALSVLDGLVAEIPTAVTELARERIHQATALYDRIRVEEEAGTLALEALREQAARMRNDAEGLAQQLAQQGHANDEELLRVDQELERVGAALGAADAQIAGVIDQRVQATALLDDATALLSRARERWQVLVGQGANDPEIQQRLQSADAGVRSVQACLEQRTPQAYSEAVETGDANRTELTRLGNTLALFDETIKAARQGVAGDVAALEDARQALLRLQERAVPLEADASLASLEQAAEAYRQAEDRIHVGTLAAFREAVEVAARGKELLGAADARARESTDLADRVTSLLEAVSAERRQQLGERVDAIAAEMGAYAVIWKSRLSGTATAAGQALSQAADLLAQLPAEVTRRQRLLQSALPEQATVIASAHELVALSEARLSELEAARTAVLNERQELEAGVATLQGRLSQTDALGEQMLPEVKQAVAHVRERLDNEGRTMLDPTQADYQLALANWLPSLDDELDAALRQHDEDARRLTRALKEWRGRLDRNWRRLQSMLDRDPRRPEEDVDQLYQAFEAWWEHAEAAEGQPAAVAELVDVQAPEIDARIQRAVGQLEDGRRTNRDLMKELQRRRRDVERRREDVTKLAADSGWPQVSWDLREPDNLWRRMGEAENASMGMPTIDHANGALQQAILLATQALEAYERSRDLASSELTGLDRLYQAAARAYDEATRQAAELRAQGPSPELTALESRLDAARRDLDAARGATSVAEATQRLELAQGTLRSATG